MFDHIFIIFNINHSQKLKITLFLIHVGHNFQVFNIVFNLEINTIFFSNLTILYLIVHRKTRTREKRFRNFTFTKKYQIYATHVNID